MHPKPLLLPYAPRAILETQVSGTDQQREKCKELGEWRTHISNRVQHQGSNRWILQTPASIQTGWGKLPSILVNWKIIDILTILLHLKYFYNLYWVTSREQFAIEKLPPSPHKILPTISNEMWGAVAIVTPPRAPNMQEHWIVLFGPYFPPRNPPRKQPIKKPMFKELAEKLK